MLLLAAVVVSCFVVVQCAVPLLASSADKDLRGAIVVTLAGTHKLSEYFEWSCRSISASSLLFDMLVFHEGNSKLQNIHCAQNVKFIDLGSNGLSKLVVSQVLAGTNTSDTSRVELSTLLADIVLHIPRYLVEAKPMTGSLFKDYLLDYSHWTYTDPDIIWGSLSDWIEQKDLVNFDLLTLAKTFDAGRLFVRGQFALHKNDDKMNLLWRKLEYFSPNSFAKRLGNAARMLRERKSTDDIFATNFHSAEGYYSEVVFHAGVEIKIAGRGLDDYSTDPVVLHQGRLCRCSSSSSITTSSTECIEKILQLEQTAPNATTSLTIHNMPKLRPKAATAHHDKSICRMQWLPVAVRYCLASSVYDKNSALAQDKQDSLRLDHVGEAFTVGKGTSWYVNDEKLAKRQVSGGEAAFFHFRHWDDYASTSIATNFGSVTSTSTTNIGDQMPCMVLHLRNDKTMAFEPCQVVIQEPAAKDDKKGAAHALKQQRREREKKRKRGSLRSANA